MDYYCKIEKELQPFINVGDYEIIESNEFFYRSYTKKEMIYLSRVMGHTIKTKYKKNEVVDLFVKRFMNEETIEEGLITLNNRGVQLLSDILNHKANSGHLNLIDIANLKRDENLGFFFTTTDNTLVINNQAADIMRKILKKKDFQLRRQKLSYLHMILSYCDMIYGIIGIEYVQKLYQYKYPKTRRWDIIKLYKQLPAPAMHYAEDIQ